MTPWVLRIIVANAVMFLIQSAAPAVERELMFVPSEVFFRPWTAFTYMFLHGGVGHILFNMLALFFFGPRLEGELGAGRFLRLYVISGLGGAALSFLFSYDTAVIGASGAVYGVFLGYAWYWPRSQIFIWGLFPVESRWLIIVMTALSIFGGFTGGGGGIAHFAHLGGFLGGYLYLKLSGSAPGGRVIVAGGTAQGAGERPPSVDPGAVARWRSIPTDRMHEVNREEYRRIMLKLDAGGEKGLTPEEIAFLERFSAR